MADGVGVTTGAEDVGTTVGRGELDRCGVLVGDRGLVGVADKVGLGVRAGRDVAGAVLGAAVGEAAGWAGDGVTTAGVGGFTHR